MALFLSEASMLVLGSFLILAIATFIGLVSLLASIGRTVRAFT